MVEKRNHFYELSFNNKKKPNQCPVSRIIRFYLCNRNIVVYLSIELNGCCCCCCMKTDKQSNGKSVFFLPWAEHWLTMSYPVTQMN